MNVHLIGIGGSGLSGIARLLLRKGYQVSGSDRQLSDVTRQLAREGARVFAGHHPDYVKNAAWVLRSSAIPDDHVEVQAARAAGLPVLKRADILADLIGDRYVLAVAGTHGKTTTSAMLAWVLTALGQNPGYLVGSGIPDLGTNADLGSGPHFVIEADEYDYMFLGLEPSVAVVTNVEHDHPDFFDTGEDFYKAFIAFSERLKPGGVLLGCSDDAGAARLLDQTAGAGLRTMSYGMERQPDILAQGVEATPEGGMTFNFLSTGQPLVRVRLGLPGNHNVLNSLAVLAVVQHLDLPVDRAAAALASFQGTLRRFQVRESAGGVTVIDDYAHHPTEIRATLAAARGRFPQRRLWAVWQPHTYSRTRTFSREFQKAFEDADQVVVMDIFAAREPRDSDFSIEGLVAAMDHPQARYVGGLDAVAPWLVARLEPGDVVIVLSAGDADRLSEQVATGLQNRRQAHVRSEADL